MDRSPLDKPPIGKVLAYYGADLNTARGYGQWRRIRCPFHDDKTPSAQLNEELDAFNCFTCGIAGDSWKIICDQEGVTFNEAKRFAVERFGYESTSVLRPASKRRPYRPSWEKLS